jgi:outer membrane protein assembly factor BamB
MLSIVVMSAPALAADQADITKDRLWQSAAVAYQSGQFETGHFHLRALVDKNEGNLDLAIKCLEEILRQARRDDANRLAKQRHITFIDSPLAEYAARRLCALERIGVISANRKSVHEAFTVQVDHDVRHGRLIEAFELIDRFVEANPHDPFWRIHKARVYRKLDSAKTRPLFDKLRAEMDLDHPDPTAREHWTAFSDELEKLAQFGVKLPHEIRPLPKGSPLPLMEPDDPDGEWAVIANRPVRAIPSVIDRLAAKALIPEQIVEWSDSTGITDPARALDLHLLSQPPADLAPLRRLQAQRYAREDLGASGSDAEILAMSRRYAWALGSQQQLQKLANQKLLAGHAESALRSFRNLLEHTTDKKLRDLAQVGYWTSRAQTGNVRSLDELLGEVAPDRVFSWFGKPTKASAICRQLIENRSPAPAATQVRTLKELIQHVVHIPPISPWSTDLSSTVDITVAGRDLLVSGRNLLAMYDARRPDQPVWKSLPLPNVGQNKPVVSHPGYFRPQLDKGRLYTRWGFGSQAPHGIAGIDHSTGRSLWLSDRSASNQPIRNVPLSDPVLSDGLLYYLQWGLAGNVNHGRGRRLMLVCFDPQRREPVWQYTIATGGLTSDITESLQRALPATATYGNRVTIHEGAIYSSSNCGIVTRSDVRDGRTDWIHTYRPTAADHRSVLNHGSSPIIAGNTVICMPRDAHRVFALDQTTGRLLWENSSVLGVQLVGVVEDSLIVRGQTNIAGLDLYTGEVRWYRPTGERVLGRASLLGSSIYFAQLDGLHRLDAKTGDVQGVRPWGLKNEKPQNFAIHGRDLYVVSDRPDDGFGRQTDRPLNPSGRDKGASLALPLASAWQLPRENAKISMPPKNSPLHGSAYICSEGILERVDLSAQGRIRWHRFVDVHEPTFHFIGNTMLIAEHSRGNTAGLINRVVALDATNGRTLWEHAVRAPVSLTLNCGTTQLFHDANGRMVAIDLSTGRLAWERNLGDGFQMRLSWTGQRLHVFYVSRLRAAHHMVLDPQDGHTVSDNTIAARASDDAKNAKEIKGGYLEVRIKPILAQYVRLVALSEVNGRSWASISELQVIDSDGNNLPRRKWSATADNSETKANYDTSPRAAIDGDPVTWWHTQWHGGDSPHPHHFQINMGAAQTVTGFRYLPSVIVNNNGMIRDYELYVSQDGKNWGKPVAKGFLVNRTRVDQAFVSKDAIVFESSAGPGNHLDIYRYTLDGKPARLVQKNARIAYLQEPYFFTTPSKNGASVLVVNRFDNPSYRFELGATAQFDMRYVEIEGDRLVLGRKGVLVADLAKKRFIVAPSDSKLTLNQDGIVLREGPDSLIKIVSQGEKGQAVFRFNLRTGRQTNAVLSEQSKPFQPGRQGKNRSLPNFDGVVLLNDNSTVTAWVNSAP